VVKIKPFLYAEGTTIQPCLLNREKYWEGQDCVGEEVRVKRDKRYYTVKGNK